MIRFFTRVLLISTFFIGLGAITDKAFESLFPTKNELVSNERINCDLPKIKQINYVRKNPQIKTIKIENTSNLGEKQFQFQMILPHIEELQTDEILLDNVDDERKIYIFQQDVENIN